MVSCMSSATPPVGPNIHLSSPRPSSVRNPEPGVDSHALLQGRRTLQIRHEGQQYCLRHTRNGKLILTK